MPSLRIVDAVLGKGDLLTKVHAEAHGPGDAAGLVDLAVIGGLSVGIDIAFVLVHDLTSMLKGLILMFVNINI